MSESVSIRYNSSYSLKINGIYSMVKCRVIRYSKILKLLERHPFSGRCDSIGELLHTPYADSNFHGHRPIVCTTQNTLSRLSEGWSRYD
jgi:hypothetical protein